MFRELIDQLFISKTENSIIKSWKNHYKQKNDIFIKINDITKGISIKKGNCYRIFKISLCRWYNKWPRNKKIVSRGV